MSSTVSPADAAHAGDHELLEGSLAPATDGVARDGFAVAPEDPNAIPGAVPPGPEGDFPGAADGGGGGYDGHAGWNATGAGAWPAEGGEAGAGYDAAMYEASVAGGAGGADGYYAAAEGGEAAGYGGPEGWDPNAAYAAYGDAAAYGAGAGGADGAGESPPEPVAAEAWGAAPGHEYPGAYAAGEGGGYVGGEGEGGAAGHGEEPVPLVPLDSQGERDAEAVRAWMASHGGEAYVGGGEGGEGEGGDGLGADGHRAMEAWMAADGAGTGEGAGHEWNEEDAEAMAAAAAAAAMDEFFGVEYVAPGTEGAPAMERDASGMAALNADEWGQVHNGAVFERSVAGWDVYTFSHDGVTSTRFYQRRDTGVSQWEVPDEVLEADMMSKAVAKQMEQMNPFAYEGLDSDFDMRAWVPPSHEKGVEAQRNYIYGQARAPLCATRHDDLNHMGVGISLYFRSLKYLSFLFTIFTLLSIPAFLVYSNGHRIPGNAADQISLSSLTLGNVGERTGLVAETDAFGDLREVAKGNETFVSYGSTSLTGYQASYLVSYMDFGICVVFILFLVFFQRRVASVTSAAERRRVTPHDYTVFVRGLPADATEDEIREFFSERFGLDDLNFDQVPEANNSSLAARATAALSALVGTKPKPAPKASTLKAATAVSRLRLAAHKAPTGAAAAAGAAGGADAADAADPSGPSGPATPLTIQEIDGTSTAPATNAAADGAPAPAPTPAPALAPSGDGAAPASSGTLASPVPTTSGGVASAPSAASAAAFLVGASSPTSVVSPTGTTSALAGASASGKSLTSTAPRSAGTAGTAASASASASGGRLVSPTAPAGSFTSPTAAGTAGTAGGAHRGAKLANQETTSKRHMMIYAQATKKPNKTPGGTLGSAPRTGVPGTTRPGSVATGNRHFDFADVNEMDDGTDVVEVKGGPKTSGAITTRRKPLTTPKAAGAPGASGASGGGGTPVPAVAGGAGSAPGGLGAEVGADGHVVVEGDVEEEDEEALGFLPVVDVSCHHKLEYIGSWVADVAVVRGNGKRIRSYMEVETVAEELRQARARMKMYSAGTPLLSGADEKLRMEFEKKVLDLGFRLDEVRKSVEDTADSDDDDDRKNRFAAGAQAGGDDDDDESSSEDDEIAPSGDAKLDAKRRRAREKAKKEKRKQKRLKKRAAERRAKREAAKRAEAEAIAAQRARDEAAAAAAAGVGVGAAGAAAAASSGAGNASGSASRRGSIPPEELAALDRAACWGSFVTFNHEESFLRCMEAYAYSAHWWGRLCFQRKELRFRNEFRLRVETAPDPSDVVWENMDTPESNRFCRRRFTGCVTFLLLVLSFGLILLAQNAYEHYAELTPKLSLCDTEIPAAFMNGYGNVTLAEGALAAAGRGGGSTISTTLLLSRTTANGTRLFDDEACGGGRFAIGYFDSAVRPYVSYSLDACTVSTTVTQAERQDEGCPNPGAAMQCPCQSATTSSLCSTLPCFDPSANAEGTSTCESFTASTMVGCYCLTTFQRLIDEYGSWTGGTKFIEDEQDVCGDWAEAYSTAKALSTVASLAATIVNIGLQFAIAFLVGIERHVSVSEEQLARTWKTTAAQIFNTAFIVLLVQMKLPQGKNWDLLETFGILQGKHEDFSWEWYSSVGVLVSSTMLFNVITPHISPLIFYLRSLYRRWTLSSEKSILKNGVVATQSELNQFYVGPTLDLSLRYPNILVTTVVTLMYSPGLPLLYVFAVLSFTLTYWVDLFLLLRFYRKPPAYSDILAKFAQQVLPWGLLLHLGMAVFMFGQYDLLPSQIIGAAETALSSEDGELDSNSAASYFKYWIDKGQSVDGIGFVPRVVRINAFQFFILGVTVLVFLLFRHVLLTLLLSIIQACDCGLCGNVGRPRRKWIAPYTAAFGKALDNLDPDRCVDTACQSVQARQESTRVELAKVEVAQGWRVEDVGGLPVLRKVVPVQTLASPNTKTRSTPISTAGSFREGVKLRLKRSWEVMQDAGVHSYDLRKNPRYRPAMMASGDWIVKQRRPSVAQPAAGGAGTPVIPLDGATGPRDAGPEEHPALV